MNLVPYPIIEHSYSKKHQKLYNLKDMISTHADGGHSSKNWEFYDMISNHFDGGHWSPCPNTYNVPGPSSESWGFEFYKRS